jgi:hypothetical protein
MMMEYTLQIEHHIKSLFEIVQKNHWRTNPNYFVGSRVAIFRKSAGFIPGILTGYVSFILLSNHPCCIGMWWMDHEQLLPQMFEFHLN